MVWNKCQVSSPYWIDYRLEGNPEGNRIYLLLHGYGENGDTVFRHMAPGLFPSDGDALILAPNAPFPLPPKDEKGRPVGLPVAFAWYFFDPIQEVFHIDYSCPASILKALLSHLGLHERPTTVIGFSQGGYLAPFVGKKVASVDHVIGMACRFREDKLGGNLSFRLDGIHGSEDGLVDPHNAQKSHEKLLRDRKGGGVEGQFYLLEGEGHAMRGSKAMACLKNLLRTQKFENGEHNNQTV